MDTAVQRLESLMCSEIATVSDEVLEAGWVKRDQKEKLRLYKPLRRLEESYTELTRNVEEFAHHVPKLNSFVQCAVKMGSVLGPWCADRFWQALLTDDVMKSMAIHSAKSRRVDFSYDKWEAASDALESLRPLVNNHEFTALPTEEGAISSKLSVLREILCAAFEESASTKCLVFVDEQFVAMLLADYFAQPGIAPSDMIGDFMVCDGSFFSASHSTNRCRSAYQNRQSYRISPSDSE